MSQVYEPISLSDERFSIEVLGRAGLLYLGAAKRLVVDSEVLAGPSGLAVYQNSIKSWDPPHDYELIDESKRLTIVDNIRRALRFQGFAIQAL
ncbi:MAG: hypothetical protein JSU72_11745 [Deltaproteobacteria bacterium]|nr:MAG: hypothetical protein JSU72_11745 [Deltaproteobacteria bacterium]